MASQSEKSASGFVARVTHRFSGAPDGGVYPRFFEPGELIFGDLALAEVEAGRATLVDKPRETKADEPNPTPAGKETASSSRRRVQASGKKTSKPREKKRASS